MGASGQALGMVSLPIRQYPEFICAVLMPGSGVPTKAPSTYSFIPSVPRVPTAWCQAPFR